ncbi:extracellular solute-binding protein [Actinopolymorpha sp. B9G3]|uniref:ABC transporter substrate-binding protein n=1 Tax=Actinopolymorpha sp. B9G3 TaxID=3158970 RepID=UPI0032D8C1DD
MLTLLGVAGTGIGAASCVDTSGTTSGTGGSPDSQRPTGTIRIPDPAGTLPTGDVELRWMDSGDMKARFFEDFFPVYEEKHKNISVRYEGTNWNQITEVVTLGVRNGTAPDVFQLPVQITMGMAVSNRWIGAYDDIVPDFSAVKERFPAGAFADGVTDFGGKTYALPLTGQQRINTLLLFNADLARGLDVDLGTEVLTWQQFREVTKQITKQGAGRYYGTIFGLAQPGGLSTPINAMCEMAGVHGGAEGVDLRTGKFNVTNPAVIEAIELILAIKSDGSAHPDSINLDAPGARARMPLGQAGIMMQGPWNIVPWQEENPEFRLGLNLPPQQDPNDIWPSTHGPGGSNNYVYSSKSKLTAVIGDIMAYLTTAAGQVQIGLRIGAADPPALPDAIHELDPDPLQRKALELGTKHTVLRPEPAARNPDVAKVYEAQVPATPTFSDTLVGLYTGQIKDGVEAAMRQMEDRLEKSLDDAIAKARSRGADVDRDDWVFSDWDPRKPYTALYEQ